LEGRQVNSSDERSRSIRCLHDLLDDAARKHGKLEAVRDETGSMTYARLAHVSRLVAQRLVVLGVRPGDRVVCCARGTARFAALLYGASRCGAVLVPAAEAVSDYQLRWLIEDARPAVVVTDGNSRPVPYDGPTSTIDELAAGDAVEGTDVRLDDPDANAFLIYTSGTTARPKGIVCPHRTVLWAAAAIGSKLRYRETDVIYLRLPVSFDYGLYQILLAAQSGSAVVFAEGTPSARLLSHLRASGATVAPVVPTLASLLCQLARRDTRPTAVRLVTNTGARLAGASVAGVREAFPGAAIVCMYGMSECKRITIAEPDEDLDYPGTVGRPIPGTSVHVLDDASRECRVGDIGEIVSAGPHVMAGYWNATEATAERFVPAPGGRGIAVRTGDFGYVDDEGRLYFIGRRDDLFKRHGHRVSTVEIESAAIDIPGVVAAACLRPAPDGSLNIFVQSELAPTDVLKGIAERLGSARTPDRCIIVDRIPCTANGKVDKNALYGGADWDSRQVLVRADE
jgi:acyl-CoA synthetase (AMP-forming)/AMP-acid ligase II